VMARCRPRSSKVNSSVCSCAGTRLVALSVVSLIILPAPATALSADQGESSADVCFVWWKRAADPLRLDRKSGLMDAIDLTSSLRTMPRYSIEFRAVHRQIFQRRILFSEQLNLGNCRAPIGAARGPGHL